MCEIMEIVSIIKDIILSIAAVATVSLAIYGVRSWSRELRGKTEFEVARLLLRSTYKMRDVISAARAPFISAGEFPKGYGGALAKSSNQEEAEAHHHVYKNRWEPIWEALQQYDATALEAEAIWGSGIKEKTNEFRSCLNDLDTSRDFRISYLQSGRTNLDDDFAKKVHQDLHATRDSDDELSVKLRNTLDDIEQEVKPRLKR